MVVTYRAADGTTEQVVASTDGEVPETIRMRGGKTAELDAVVDAASAGPAPRSPRRVIRDGPEHVPAEHGLTVTTGWPGQFHVTEMPPGGLPVPEPVLPAPDPVPPEELPEPPGPDAIIDVPDAADGAGSGP
jgi:hypothetical protein